MDCRKDAAYEDLVPIQKKKASPRPPGSSSASRMAILLEDIQSKVQLTMEAVTGFRAEFRAEIEALRAELSRRIDVLELAVRKNSEDICQLRAEVRQNTQDIRQNTQDIQELREEIQRMREQLERKTDREALLGLQRRVEVLERRLGIQ